jgi:hypothetical protein
MTRPVLALAALIGLALTVAAAPAAGSDAGATHAYLQADYQLVRAGTTKIPRVEATLKGVLGRVRRECPGAAAGSPQNPQSTELSNEVIGSMVTAVVHLDLPAGRAFVRAVRPLRWTNGALTRQIQTYAGHVNTLVGMAEPHLCADVRAWASSGFAALAPSTLAFAPRFMDAWVALGELPPALRRYEAAADRGLAATTERLEATFTDVEARNVSTWGAIMSALGLWP